MKWVGGDFVIKSVPTERARVKTQGYILHPDKNFGVSKERMLEGKLVGGGWYLIHLPTGVPLPRGGKQNDCSFPTKGAAQRFAERITKDSEVIPWYETDPLKIGAAITKKFNVTTPYGYTSKIHEELAGAA